MNRRKKNRRPYRKHFTIGVISKIFQYSSPGSFYASSAKDRILTAVDQIVRTVEENNNKGKK
jgi:hypothetical protein